MPQALPDEAAPSAELPAALKRASILAILAVFGFLVLGLWYLGAAFATDGSGLFGQRGQDLAGMLFSGLGLCVTWVLAFVGLCVTAAAPATDEAPSRSVRTGAIVACLVVVVCIPLVGFIGLFA